jgi:hypothetical protein
MKRIERRWLLLFVFLLPAIACNLSSEPSVPTSAPAPVLQATVLGLNPVTGGPGTVITVSAGGFPAGAKVNLYIGNGTGTNAAPAAQNLTVTQGGVLSFALQLPDTINNQRLSGTTDLTFTVATVDGTARASALFTAVVGNGTSTLAPTPSDNGSAASGGGTGSGNLFITSPAINAGVVGGSIVVTGSGSAFNDTVGVQVLDVNYNVLGNAFATIQAAANAVGPWETTVAFKQPASASVGYIVAYTVNTSGVIIQQASIPIQLAGQGAVTAAPPTGTGIPPTLGNVITVVVTVTPSTPGVTTAPLTSTPTQSNATSTGSFITATQSQ